jgi:hexulose-6-phosphate isomerase
MISPRIGFMQGRLSPLIEGKIQAFPWPYWRDEFSLATQAGLCCMEWTLDADRISENPLMTADGRAEIARLSQKYGITIPSLTGDFCMQAPFWKANGAEQAARIATFEQVLRACAAAGIGILVVPLVDHGALASAAERAVLETTLLSFQPLLQSHDLAIAFESDFPPRELAAFIAGFPARSFGINYDIGNSASLGWDAAEEIPFLAPRILNVHVKDRPNGGTTVPLGEGAADLPKVFALLRAAGYGGNFILQTARAAEGAHVATLCRYAGLVALLLGTEDGA